MQRKIDRPTVTVFLSAAAEGALRRACVSDEYAIDVTLHWVRLAVMYALRREYAESGLFGSGMEAADDLETMDPGKGLHPVRLYVPMDTVRHYGYQLPMRVSWRISTAIEREEQRRLLDVAALLSLTGYCSRRQALLSLLAAVDSDDKCWNYDNLRKQYQRTKGRRERWVRRLLWIIRR